MSRITLAPHEDCFYVSGGLEHLTASVELGEYLETRLPLSGCLPLWMVCRIYFSVLLGLVSLSGYDVLPKTLKYADAGGADPTKRSRWFVRVMSDDTANPLICVPPDVLWLRHVDAVGLSEFEVREGEAQVVSDLQSELKELRTLLGLEDPALNVWLSPCLWEQHPLCLFTLDWLSELWSVLFLSPHRKTSTLAAQAEYAEPTGWVS